MSVVCSVHSDCCYILRHGHDLHSYCLPLPLQMFTVQHW